jgi:uncharacterized protein
MAARGSLTSRVREGKEQQGAKYADYFEFAEPFARLPSHRILALFRGEKEEILDLTFDPGAEDAENEQRVAERFGIADEGRPADIWLNATVHWAWRTRILVHLGVDMRVRLWQAAEDEAVRVFAANLRDLLLAAPSGPRTTMGLDPGFRTGVKVAVTDRTGKVVATATIYPHEPHGQWDKSLDTLAKLAGQHNVDLIAIGNGTASRETDRLAADLIKRHPGLNLTRAVVSEAGASVYSASAYASQELPELDVSLRGAVSIARRLQDPLAELVKIDPKSIGVGQYQHDVAEGKLSRSLDAVVEDCVNAVGVDLNTASQPLLARVSGITAGLATAIVTRRDSGGPFRTRQELMTVPRLGPKAFEQCAGFLRIRGGDDPLDASGVHPEAYPVVRRILTATSRPAAELIGSTAVLRALRPQDFTDQRFGLPTVTDILRELEKPGRDPRPEFTTATFAEGIEQIGDLEPGMVLEGVVTNVAAFGAFVDVGVHQDGLVHVSAMSRNYVSDPRSVVKPGDVVRVKVLSVDVPRKRISLTLRLDDESPRQAGGRPQADGRSAGNLSRTARGSSARSAKPGAGAGAGAGRRGARDQTPDGALADALRRAGLVGDTPKNRDDPRLLSRVPGVLERPTAEDGAGCRQGRAAGAVHHREAVGGPQRVGRQRPVHPVPAGHLDGFVVHLAEVRQRQHRAAARARRLGDDLRAVVTAGRAARAGLRRRDVPSGGEVGEPQLPVVRPGVVVDGHADRIARADPGERDGRQREHLIPGEVAGGAPRARPGHAGLLDGRVAYPVQPGEERRKGSVR